MADTSQALVSSFLLWLSDLSADVSSRSCGFCAKIFATQRVILINCVSLAGAFLFYAGLAALAFLFIYLFLPETKGKPLEEIETLFQAGWIVPGRKESRGGFASLRELRFASIVFKAACLTLEKHSWAPKGSFS